jgi:hypothetical protein
VIAAVEQLVGARGTAWKRAFTAEASVVERDGRFVLELSWRAEGDGAVRTVDGATCGEVVQAAALILALAADPALAEPGPARSAATPPAASPNPEPGVSPRAPPPAPVAPPEPAPPVNDDQGRTPVRFSGRVQGALDMGSLPSASPGVLLGGELSVGKAALVLDLLTFVPVEGEVQAGGGSFWLSIVSLRPCLPVEGGKLRVVPCAAAEAHVIKGSGRQVELRDDGFAWYLRFGATAEAGYRLNPTLSVVAGGALVLAPARPTFVIDGEIPVHTPSVVAGRLNLGFEIRL